MTTSVNRRRPTTRLTLQQKRDAIAEMRRRRDASLARDLRSIAFINR